jgi:hypothetical protein
MDVNASRSGIFNFRTALHARATPRNQDPRSDVEAEMQDIALLDTIFLALQAQATGIAGT